MPDEEPAQTSRNRPSPLLAKLFSFPTTLYRIGLGWSLGWRFLALTHRGRKSGLTRRTVLEVISFDPVTKESVVVSAYGTAADWYQNVQTEPAQRVQTGRLDYAPTQRFLDVEDRMATAERFCREHPWEAKLIPRVLPAVGAELPSKSAASSADILASLPMMAFRPGDPST